MLLKKILDVEREIYMTVTITTSISLHVNDKKEVASRHAIRNYILGTRKVSMCHQYLYGKMTAHAPTFIKKGKQL